jgi:hypothetical protein
MPSNSHGKGKHNPWKSIVDEMGVSRPLRDSGTVMKHTQHGFSTIELRSSTGHFCAEPVLGYFHLSLTGLSLMVGLFLLTDLSLVTGFSLLVGRPSMESVFAECKNSKSWRYTP